MCVDHHLYVILTKLFIYDGDDNENNDDDDYLAELWLIDHIEIFINDLYIFFRCCRSILNVKYISNKTHFFWTK